MKHKILPKKILQKQSILLLYCFFHLFRTYFVQKLQSHLQKQFYHLTTIRIDNLLNLLQANTSTSFGERLKSFFLLLGLEVVVVAGGGSGGCIFDCPLYSTT